jgi:hypothetical protein
MFLLREAPCDDNVTATFESIVYDKMWSCVYFLSFDKSVQNKFIVLLLFLFFY